MEWGLRSVGRRAPVITQGPGVYRFSGRAQAEQAIATLEGQAMLLEEQVRATSVARGYCRGCGRWGSFVQPASDDWANLIEGMLCECGLNARMRGILAAIDALLQGQQNLTRAAVFEQLTVLFGPMRSRIPGLIGSEYLGHDRASGDIVTVGTEKVRHESLARTSYRSGSLGLAMHFDVLEHVPDPVQALRECHRILKRGGWLLFSSPFYEGLDSSIVRARVIDGALQHDLPPCYHGNPVDGGGALVFTQFGWDLLEMMKEAGFSQPQLWLAFNPAEGVLSNGCPYPDGHTWPIVFAAQK
ncbi:SAM-dependent methyltransferase [Lysobacter niabensis]|uniref:SAM-dependent methyltransferase n=1 Tax=Agrilutibacter niabensis TaxID=380628 RepID=A0ABU1VUD6_9GAMM|nr:methyltransferase domain-containing protein [Lysobacter niabensis]MDR7100823.1 SAM-dependent methyltransferase [Lysobacter niabensis]